MVFLWFSFRSHHFGRRLSERFRWFTSFASCSGGQEQATPRIVASVGGPQYLDATPGSAENGKVMGKMWEKHGKTMGKW